MADLVSGFNVISKLGDGARSQVFQVVQPATGKVFALKRVIKEDHEDDRFLKQAITEFEISRRFDHPCLRKAYELKRIRRFFRLREVQAILEFVDGISLDRVRPDRIDKTLDIFLRVAEGLQAMHDAGFLHTDIKPNNVLLTLDGSVKIIDFGQACPIGVRKQRIQGTPDYIAPEQVERRSLTRETDVFNFGATLYWALTGRTYPTLITQKGRRQEVRPESSRVIPTPGELNKSVPPALSKLVMESCAYDRAMRPKTIHDVVKRIEMVQQILSMQTEANGRSEPIRNGETVAAASGPRPSNGRRGGAA